MIIYKVTNKINGKVYIGKTKYTLNDRKSQHFSECKLYNTHNKFHNALRKYGRRNFEWEIIDRASTEEELNSKEIFWIRELDCINKGYNISKGGNGGDNLSNNPRKEEIRKRVGLGVRNSSRWTEERKRIASLNFRGENNPMRKHPERSFFNTDNPMKREEYKRRGENNPMYNLEIREKQRKAVNTPEHKKKLSLAGKKIKGIKRSPTTCQIISESKSKYYICQYTLEGELLHIFSTRKELLEKFGKEPPRFINDSCKYLNFNWKRFRKNEITKEEILEL